MQANRRAVRPDGQYYRQTRRQRMAKPFAAPGTGGGALFMTLLLVGGLLAFVGFQGGLWHRVLGFGGAGTALLVASVLLIINKR